MSFGSMWPICAATEYSRAASFCKVNPHDNLTLAFNKVRKNNDER